MGNLFSGNYKKRRALVENCYRIEAPGNHCGHCGRGVQFLYSLPNPPLVFACRHCLNLGFASSYKRQIVNRARRLAAIGPRVDELINRIERGREQRAQREPAARRPIMESEPELLTPTL